MTRIQSIQILRVAAALGVISLHCLQSWEQLAKTYTTSAAHLGGYGVDLFFVISGFIICNVARSAPTAAEFLRRRFLRVAPLYYVQTAPYVVGGLATGKLLLAGFATSLLFWPIWGAKPSFPLLAVGWSLGFEALFYTSLSLVVRFGSKGAIGLLAVYAGAFLLNVAGAGGVFQFIGNPLLLEFLLGVAIALIPARKQRPLLGLVAVGLACWLLVYRAGYGLGPTHEGTRAFDPIIAACRVYAAGPPAFLLVWGALQFEPWCKGALARVFGYLGDASYSIYLTHPLVIVVAEFAWRNTTGTTLLAMPFVEYAVGVAAGVLAYERLEKPILAVLHRRPPGRRAGGGLADLPLQS